MLIDQPPPTIWNLVVPSDGSAFRGRQVVVTGGAGRIGSALADAFAAEGARVLAIDMPTAEFPHAVDGVSACRVDVVDHDAVIAACSALDGVDVLVHCAAIHDLRPAAEFERDVWARTFETNVFAPALTTLGLEEQLCARPGGNVVIISSINGTQPSPWPSYAASKAALDKVTTDLASRLAPKGVRVNAVAPAYTVNRDEDAMTRRHAAHLLAGVPIPTEAIVHAVMFLADSQRSPMTTGQRLVVDGGVSVMSSD